MNTIARLHTAHKHKKTIAKLCKTVRIILSLLLKKSLNTFFILFTFFVSNLSKSITHRLYNHKHHNKRNANNPNHKVRPMSAIVCKKE